MIENMREVWDRVKADLGRFASILALVLILAGLDALITLPESLAFLTSVFSSSMIVLVIVAVSHLLRRALFPSLDLKEFARAAFLDPRASAIIFLGVCIVLSVLIYANVILLA